MFPLLTNIFKVIVEVVAVGIISTIFVIGSSNNNRVENPKTEIGTLVTNATSTAEIKSEIPIKNETSTTTNKTTNEEITTPKIKVNEPNKPTSKPATSTQSQKQLGESIQVSIKNITPTISPSIQNLNETTRNATINILCETISGGTLNPITGSGVIIDERGVILTNAHIAQLFLLEDFPNKGNVNCIIRTGSPAQPKYKAKLLYISPKWVETNKSNIKATNPLGTGENDFALLLITNTVNQNQELPVKFSALVPNIDEMTPEGVTGDTYIGASYPAGFLGGIAVQKDLFLTSSVVTAKEIFTFKETTLDLIGLGGSPVAQKGSSGGPLVRQADGKLVGIIVTTTEEKNTSERDLRAITTTHINRSMLESSKKSLPEFLIGDLEAKVNAFRNSTFIYLKNLLVNELTS